MKLISTSRLILRDESGFYKYLAATRLVLLHSLVPLRLSTASSFAPIPSDIRLGSCLRESLDGRESPAPDDWWHRRSRRLALRLACQSLWRFPDTNALTRKGFAATLPTHEFETRSWTSVGKSIWRVWPFNESRTRSSQRFREGAIEVSCESIDAFGYSANKARVNSASESPSVTEHTPPLSPPPADVPTANPQSCKRCAFLYRLCHTLPASCRAATKTSRTARGSIHNQRRTLLRLPMNPASRQL